MKNQNIYTIIAFVAVIVFFLSLRSCEQDRSAVRILSYENALKTKRNDLDQQVANNRLIVDSYMNFKAVMKGTVQHKDSELTRLEALISKRTTAAIALSTTTTHTATVPVVTTRDEDHMPVYEGTVVSEWDSVHVIASIDSMQVTYKTRNEFDIRQYWERRGLFGRESFVEVTNRNPHTETTGLRAFKLEEEKKNRGMWIAIGAAAAIIGLHYAK